MPSRFNELTPPVTLIAKGAGVVVFDDAARLFEWLETLPQRGETLLGVQRDGRTIREDDVAALETLVWLCGFKTLKRAGERFGNPYSRFPTKWSWDHLGEYLGWEWRSL